MTLFEAIYWKDKAENLEEQLGAVREQAGEVLAIREQTIADLQAQLEAARRENATLREFWSAHWAVEEGVGNFDLHAEAVERLRAATEAMHKLIARESNPPPASSPASGEGVL